MVGHSSGKDGAQFGAQLPCQGRGVHQGVHQGYTPRSTKTKVRAAAQCCTEDMFPSPQRDLWHERLLSIPLVPQPDIKAPEKLTMARSIPLSLYQPERSEDWSESVRRTNGLLPALMYSALQPRTVEVFDSRRNSFSLSDATIMVLESPLRFITPVAAHDGWNHAVLCSNISESVPVYDFNVKKKGRVTLQNVFLEFSPLDSPGLTRPETSGHEFEALRAIWLVRSDKSMATSIFYQMFPRGEITEIKLSHILLKTTTRRKMRPLVVSQTFIVPSREPETSRCPSGVNATEVTQSLWPFRIRFSPVPGGCSAVHNGRTMSATTLRCHHRLKSRPKLRAPARWKLGPTQLRRNAPPLPLTTPSGIECDGWWPSCSPPPRFYIAPSGCTTFARVRELRCTLRRSPPEKALE